MSIRLLLLSLAIAILPLAGCSPGVKDAARAQLTWSASVLPSSVRLNPVTGKIIDDRPDIYPMEPLGNLLAHNWVYDGDSVQLYAARGEYVSFQLVVSRNVDETLRGIEIGMEPFFKDGAPLDQLPELYLEWAVEVREYSTGYEKSSLGPGWYPDALIPLELLNQRIDDKKRVFYPLELPDFRNRVPGQRHLVVWVDQFIPFGGTPAASGRYTSMINVRIDGRTKSIPLKLDVWDFQLANENKLACNLQHEGFMSGMDQELELQVYQLFKQHRVVPADPTYKPDLTISASGKVRFDWNSFDTRMGKYLTGEAFTEKYGYSGPGYGQPLEQYILPFDVYGKYDTRGWPDVGAPEVERNPANRKIYVDAVRQAREHILSLVDPEKTRLIIYLNGLDESYFPEAWDRMVYYGELFKEHFPESRFRADGSYSEEAMQTIHGAIDYWCCHTIGYNMPTIEAYRKLGVQDWLYGPMLYESRINSWCGSSTFLDLQLVNERAISWSTWKYRALTWCSWGIGSHWRAAWYNTETGKDYNREDLDKPFGFRRFNGKALMVYAPGIVPRVDVPCASLRLKTMRDGVEEYEMFRLLSELDGNRDRADALVDRIINEPFGEKGIGRLDIWQYDPGKWDAVRIETGVLIEEALNRAL